MRAFTASRSDADSDELWLVEHAPVYTAGTAARAEHFPRSNEPESIHAGIPLERIDRGGQITYHGPGQAVIYTMIDLARRKLTVRGLVTILEQAVIDTLAAHAVVAVRRPKAPGVYVGDAKIAALGLRVSRGCSYHGLAINCEMDLRPYASIDPCGFPGLAVTQTNNLGIALEWEALGLICAERIVALTRLGTSLRP